MVSTWAIILLQLCGVATALHRQCPYAPAGWLQPDALHVPTPLMDSIDDSRGYMTPAKPQQVLAHTSSNPISSESWPPAQRAARDDARAIPANFHRHLLQSPRAPANSGALSNDPPGPDAPLATPGSIHEPGMPRQPRARAAPPSAREVASLVREQPVTPLEAVCPEYAATQANGASSGQFACRFPELAVELGSHNLVRLHHTARG